SEREGRARRAGVETNHAIEALPAELESEVGDRLRPGGWFATPFVSPDAADRGMGFQEWRPRGADSGMDIGARISPAQLNQGSGQQDGIPERPELQGQDLAGGEK